MDDPLLSVVLPFTLTNGNGGRGGAFWKSAKDRRTFEQQLRAMGQVRRPFAVPVRLVVTRLLGPRQRFWDYSSGFRGNWKELEDALVACGWFVDDGPSFIRGLVFEQEKHDKAAVRIDVYEWMEVAATPVDDAAGGR